MWPTETKTAWRFRAGHRAGHGGLNHGTQGETGRTGGDCDAERDDRDRQLGLV